MTAPLLNARQQVRVSRVPGDVHFKQMSRGTVCVTRKRTVTSQWPRVPSIGQHFQPFIGNGNVSKRVKDSRVGRKTTNE